MAKPVIASEAADASAPRRVRFGLTVGKRLARHSVDRVLIKRIMREAARHCAPSLAAIAVSDFDIVLRLKAPLPARATITRKQLKRALRDDVDTVLRRLCDRLAADKSA